MATSSPISRSLEPQEKLACAIMQKILRDKRTRLALAQLFDGTPIEITALQMNDIESSIEFFPLPPEATEAATLFAKNWLEDQVSLIEEIVGVSDPLKEEDCVATFATSKQLHALLHEFIVPHVRLHVGEFYLRCKNGGRNISSERFQKRIRKKSSSEAIQQWSMEFIFGGQLLHNDNMLEIQPLYNKPFRILYTDALETLKAGLPFQCPLLPTSKVPRLEDDHYLYKYLESRRGT